MTVCGYDWYLLQARIVCRMLGFEGALAAPGSAKFGQGSGDVLRVDCWGTEESLADCFSTVDSSCGHHMDAGAVCYSGNPFQVRLVGGSNDAEGRVEILHEGSWGTICVFEWDLKDARVVCRMLGFDGALDAPGSARFGQGSGRILLAYFNCMGTEDNLADCAHGGIGDYTSCGHAGDAGVICYSGAHPQPLQVRLIGGSNDAEGRVEVMYEGSWGTICHFNWDLRDARVVCRMIGFDGALDAPRSARFGQGSGRILLVYVNCEGTEDNLADCVHEGVGDYTSCGHAKDAGVICYSGAHPEPFQVRLIGGSTDAEGRVEVKHEGSWGTICNLGWDVRDAIVVCRMIGFDGALDAPGSARFGQGSGRILLAYVGCDGTEDNLADCAHPGIQRFSCSHTNDAGAVCKTGEPFQVRLTNGTTDSEGRVEVSYKGSWGTICDDNWDLRDARVVCKMLGFDGALAAPGSATFGAGSGKILFDDVGCKGTEDTLAECYHRGFGVNNCEHDSDAGVICFIEDPFQVRLVNGSNDAEGRVEVLHDGSWGTICDDWWDLKDARVVCRMLGFNDALAAPISARFGQGPGQSLLTYVSCGGTEDHLADCFHAGVGSSHCSHGSDAGASCSLGVRLVNGADGYEGRVEILHEGSWGTVCDDLWDLNDAKVVCRQLRFDGAVAVTALPQARFGQGHGEIFLDGVQCNGTETILKDCKHDGIGVHNCVHKEDASVICRHGGLMNYSDLTNSDEIPFAYTTKLLQIGHETTTVPPKMQGQNFSTPRHPLYTSKIGNLKSTAVPILLVDFRMIILIGLCILLLSCILIASLGYCIHRFKKRMAARNLDTEIYMDVTTMSSMHALSHVTGYQALNIAPKLPERRKSDVFGHHYESNIEKIKDNHDGDLEEDHEYADMNTVYQTPQTDKDLDIDGYLLPNTEIHLNDRKSVSDKRKPSDEKAGTGSLSQGIKENMRNDYMEMKTVYQKPKTGTDIDLDGYVIPNAMPSLTDDDTVTYELTRENNEKESNFEIACTGGEGKVPLAEDMLQKEIHKYMDMKTVYQTPQTDKDLDIDGYLLPNTEIPLNDGKSVLDTKNGCCKMDMPKPSDEKAGTGSLFHGIKENMKNDYMEMKTVYQKPKTGTDIALDGCVLQNTMPSLNDDDTVTYELTKSNMEIACTGGEGKVPLPQDTTQEEIQEYMDIKTVYQSPATGINTDLDGYLLPSAMLETESIRNNITAASNGQSDENRDN